MAISVVVNYQWWLKPDFVSSGFMSNVQDVITSQIEDAYEELRTEMKKDLEEMRTKLMQEVDERIQSSLQNSVADSVKREISNGGYMVTGHIESARSMAASADELANQITNPIQPNNLSAIHVTVDDSNNESYFPHPSDSFTPRAKNKGSPKFQWTGTYEAAGKFIKSQVMLTGGSRSRVAKKEIYKLGLEKNLWPRDTQWQLRVFNKVDSCARVLSD